MAGQQIDHHARMSRIEVLDQNEGHAGADRERSEQPPEGIEATRRGAEPDDREAVMPGRATPRRRTPARRRASRSGPSRTPSSRHPTLPLSLPTNARFIMLPRKLCHDDVGKTGIVDTVDVDKIRPAGRVEMVFSACWLISDSGLPISTSSL
jgi:hypothetical protein